MKKIIILSVISALLLAGCAAAPKADSPTVGDVLQTSDEASSEVRSKNTAAQVSSAAASNNEASTGKNESKKSSSGQTSSAKVGDKDDPIRSLSPNDARQYVADEAPIVSDPEPEYTYTDKYSDMDESLKVDSSWFDDCVFIGDSTLVCLSSYNDASEAFGDAKFVCSVGLSYCNSQWDLNDPNSVHPYYNGQKILIENACEVTGANKAIISLGMNDVEIFGPDEAMGYVRTLIPKLRANSPGVKIYLQTLTPMLYARQKPHFNNDLIRDFNSQLRQYADSEGIAFLDSFDAFVNSNGNLPHEFCYDSDDMGVHLNFEGCAVWGEFLRAAVGTAYGEEIVHKDPPKSTDSSKTVSDSDEYEEVSDNSDDDETQSDNEIVYSDEDYDSEDENDYEYEASDNEEDDEYYY